MTLAVAPLGAQPFEFKEYGVAIDMPQGMGWQPYKSSIHVDGLVELVTAGNSSNVITLFVADGGTDTAYTSLESLQRLLDRAGYSGTGAIDEITVSGFPALQQDHRSSGMDITVGSRTIAVAAGRRAYVLMIIASRKDIESNPDIAATVASLRIAGGGLRLNLLPLALGGAGLALLVIALRHRVKRDREKFGPATPPNSDAGDA